MKYYRTILQKLNEALDSNSLEKAFEPLFDYDDLYDILTGKGVLEYCQKNGLDARLLYSNKKFFEEFDDAVKECLINDFSNVPDTRKYILKPEFWKKNFLSREFGQYYLDQNKNHTMELEDGLDGMEERWWQQLGYDSLNDAKYGLRMAKKVWDTLNPIVRNLPTEKQLARKPIKWNKIK